MDHTQHLRFDDTYAIHEGEEKNVKVEEQSKIVTIPGLKKLINSDSYWGDLGHSDTDRLLCLRPAGTYLIRNPLSGSHNVTLAWSGMTGAVHKRAIKWKHCEEDCCHYSVFKFVSKIQLENGGPLHKPLRRNFPLTLKLLSATTVAATLKYDEMQLLHVTRNIKQYLSMFYCNRTARMEYEWKYRCSKRKREPELY